MVITELAYSYQYALCFTVQLAYTIIRTNNIQHAVHGSILANQVSSTLLIIAYLVSSTLGIKGVMEGDWWMLFFYLSGNNIGLILILARQGRIWRAPKKNTKPKTLREKIWPKG